MHSLTTVSSLQPARDGAHQVPLGHDPGEPPVLQHQDRPDVAVHHPPGHRDDRQPGLHGQQVARHVAINRGHARHSTPVRGQPLPRPLNQARL
jgi:hypothetical protein